MTFTISHRLAALAALLVLCAHLGVACTTDADCGDVDQAGLCQGGVCQCGAGFSGDALIDPSACSLTCEPAAVPDSATFLAEPIIALGANAGNLQFNVTLDHYSKQVPTTVAFLNPTTGTACGLMPALLGTGKWSQQIFNNGGECDQELAYSTPFAAAVAENCWETLAPSTEAGSQFTVTFNSYRTQVEVIQSGLAPFGLAVPSRKRQSDETTITREFRRDYTVSVATQFRPSSAPFQVIAGGRVRYRLVSIDYDLLSNKIVATVETEVAVEAKLTATALNEEDSSGLSAVLGDPTFSIDCDVDASSPGFCNQFHVIEFSDEPCAVASAEMVLDVTFSCADGSDPATCGFTNLPTNNVYTLPNLLLDYDSCPRVIEYGVDGAASFLRLHTDVTRATPVSAPALLGDVLYGRCSIEPAGDATFQSVTLSALKVFQVASPANIDLGNQLSSSFLTLLSDAEQISPLNAVWNFDLEIDSTFFDITQSYFLEATIDLVFANTGALSKRLVIIPVKPATRMLVTRQDSDDDSVSAEDEVRSSTFRMSAAPKDEEEAAEEGGSSSSSIVLAVAGAVGGIALCAIAAVLIVVVVRKRRRRKEEEEAGKQGSGDAMKDIESQSDTSSDTADYL